MPDNNASPSNDSSRQDQSLPFFTRFLEGQNNLEQSAATKKFPYGLDEARTLKYPSDDDDNPPPPDDVTLQTRGASNQAPHMTLKYPSDRDEMDFI